MAIGNDQVFAYVTGTVERIFESGKGPAFRMSVQGERDKYPSYVTVWSDPTVPEGHRVSVSGFMSWRRKELDSGKVVFDVMLNGARVKETGEPSEPRQDDRGREFKAEGSGNAWPPVTGPQNGAYGLDTTPF